MVYGLENESLMASVNLEKVEKVYAGGVRAVNGVHLNVADEEFVVLVGPSGCGKSTTLRMVSGLEEVTSGTIQIGDRVVNDVRPKDRDIAMVFQNHALYPHMTVYRNLAFALTLRKVPKAEIRRRVNWVAGLLGLQGLLDRKPNTLSGGQRQRVAIGRAIVRQPQVFLFDEPLSNLDAQLRVRTRVELKRLQQQLSTTTIYVTHDQEEAMTLGDRVAVMHNGNIHQCDSPLAVYRHPVDRFVAGFVGLPPMNFIDGKLVKATNSIRFEGGGIQFTLSAEHSTRLKDRKKADVVLGIRPEGLSLAKHSADIPVTVEVVETLGAQMDLFMRTAADAQLVCRTSTEAMDPGVQLHLNVDRQAVQIFDVNTEDAAGVLQYGKNLTLVPCS